MIVMKFGGTSVQDATCMDQALDIVLNQVDRAPVMISSAMARMTDSLLKLGELTDAGKHQQASDLITTMIERHHQAADEFLTQSNLSEAKKKLNQLADEMRWVVKGLSIDKEPSVDKGPSVDKQCSKQKMDSILSFGELLSTTLLAYRIKERGYESVWLDSRSLIRTDCNFGSAAVNFIETEKLIKSAVNPKAGKVYVAQGFIGSTSSNENDPGITTTLGRGGSDYSASIYGASLDAEEIQIWTDVNGIMTTDPRIVKTATTIEQISYEEAAELAFFGAKVVHPSTIQPAIGKQIPVLVLNTKDAKGKFTSISSKTGKKGLKAIAGKKDITLININSSRMLNAYGFLSRIFHIFEKYKTPVDLIATSEVSVSMTIENAINIEPIRKELEEIGNVSIEEEKSILCMVGQQLWKDPAFISRAFGRLTDIPIRMISLGSSDTNLSCVVPLNRLNDAITSVHEEFFD